MQNWKNVCSSKLLVLVPVSFKLHSVNDYFGLALQVKHSITRWKLELGDRVSNRLFKLYFESSYTVLIKTGQARSASHLLPEMQKYSSAASGAFTPAFAKWPVHLLFSTITVCCSCLVPFTSSTFQGAANVSVLIVTLGKPRHIATEWLALVIRNFGT